MRILICSDSHGNLEFFHDTIIKEEPELIIFTGDYSDDALSLENIFNNIPFLIVRGNCDYFDKKTKDELLFENVDLGKTYITHGHMYSVKSTKTEIEKRAKELEVNFVVFGHTHIPYYKELDGIIYLNPGAMTDEYYAMAINGEIVFKKKGVEIEI